MKKNKRTRGKRNSRSRRYSHGRKISRGKKISRGRRISRGKRNSRSRRTTKRNLRRNPPSKRNSRKKPRTKRNSKRNSRIKKILDGGSFHLKMNQFMKDNNLYFIRHGLSCANLAKVGKMHNMKAWYDPFLSEKGLDLLQNKTSTLQDKVNDLKSSGANNVFFASPLLRAQITCCALFELTSSNTLIILPYCGESQNVFDKHVDHTDNIPLLEVWKSTDKDELEGKIKKTLELQLGEGNVPKIDLSIFDAERSSGQTFFDIARHPPDLTKCLECLKTHVEGRKLNSIAATVAGLISHPDIRAAATATAADAQKIRLKMLQLKTNLFVVTHSHFMKHNGILRKERDPNRVMGEEDKPENNSIYKIKGILMTSGEEDEEKLEAAVKNAQKLLDEDAKVEDVERVVKAAERLQLNYRLDVDYENSFEPAGIPKSEEDVLVESDEWSKKCNELHKRREEI